MTFPIAQEMTISNQALFNRIAKHLLTQQECSYDAYTCLYRGPNGLKCAVGALIDDEHYSPDLENDSPLDAEVRKALEDSLHARLTTDNVQLLLELQDIHDHADVENWSDQLAMKAEEYKLEYKPMELLA